MLKKIKNIITKIDLFLYKKFGSEKKLYFLENLKEAKKIFSLLNENEKETKVRFVGGCVRKALCNENIDDIDLATSLNPSEVKKRLFKKNIKIIDTGITHGTVTAIINNFQFEITTLRKDISTDGRHANVKFTEKWDEDALRRDFTINAIYADIDGKIFDPTNGISDLENGIVKFIGSPEERIKEDYLRILRYFRFFAQYSSTDYDVSTIQSIKKNINGINKISNERIFNEVKKILSLANLSVLFNNEQLRQIILNIFPQFKYYERLKNVEKLDNDLKTKFKYQQILPLLIVDQTNNYEFFCYKYKTSNEIRNKLKNISKNFENLKSKNFFSKQNIKKLIYYSDKNIIEDLLLFSISINDQVKISKIVELLEYIKIIKKPKFPISGEYLKECGYKSGPDLGRKLKFLEEKWIQNNFILDEKEIEKSLNKKN